MQHLPRALAPVRRLDFPPGTASQLASLRGASLTAPGPGPCLPVRACVRVLTLLSRTSSGVPCRAVVYRKPPRPRRSGLQLPSHASVCLSIHRPITSISRVERTMCRDEG